jgi:DNA-directed RNA polymerase I subunit RPA2
VLTEILLSLGTIPHTAMDLRAPEPIYPVLLDGTFLGLIPRVKAAQAERILRAMKVNPMDDRVPFTTEIALIRHSPDPANIQTQYPGLYVFTEPSRMIRPVKNLVSFYFFEKNIFVIQTLAKWE